MPGPRSFPQRRGRASKPFWLCLAGLFLLSACAPGGDPNHLTIAGPFEFTSQEPARDGYVFQRLQVAETLTEIAEDGQLAPGLARSWQVSEDGLVWRFILQSGVRFHDGTQLDARTTVDSLRAALPRSASLADAPIVDLRAKDADTVEIRLSRPWALLPAALSHYSAVVLAPASYDGDGYVTRMLGTGPYRIEHIEPPHHLEVVRTPAATHARIDRVSYLTGHRAESRTLQVLSGQTDLVYTLDPSSLDPLRRSPGVSVHEQLIPRTLQIKVNAGDPRLSDVRARQALSLALDRTGLAETVLRMPGTAAHQVFPPLFDHWHLPDLPAPERDLPRARALLAELGWTPGSDEILVREGQRFELSLMTYADRPELVQLATAIQAQWRELGVAVSVDVENSGSIPLGHTTGTLELALMARNYGSFGDPLGTVRKDFGGNGGGDWGAMNWDNSAILPRLAKLEAETDPLARRALARQVAQVIHAELPVIPVLYYVQQTAVSDRVRGFSFDPFERSYRIAEMELVAP